MFSYIQELLVLGLNYVRNPDELVRVAGLWGLVAIVFAETGILLGFFLPGDSLLITAGILASQGTFSIFELCVLLSVAAIVGDATGYYIGHKTGDLLYSRKESFLFKKNHLLKAQAFYEKHGGKTIFLARFIPIIRTFAPTVAGAAKMNYRKFASYNLIGGIFWVLSMCLLGYFVGKQFGKRIDEYILFIIIAVVFVSFIPIIVEWIKVKKQKASL